MKRKATSRRSVCPSVLPIEDCWGFSFRVRADCVTIDGLEARRHQSINVHYGHTHLVIASWNGHVMYDVPLSLVAWGEIINAYASGAIDCSSKRRAKFESMLFGRAMKPQVSQ